MPKRIYTKVLILIVSGKWIMEHFLQNIHCIRSMHCLCSDYYSIWKVYQLFPVVSWNWVGMALEAKRPAVEKGVLLSGESQVSHESWRQPPGVFRKSWRWYCIILFLSNHTVCIFFKSCLSQDKLFSILNSSKLHMLHPALVRPFPHVLWDLKSTAQSDRILQSCR